MSTYNGGYILRDTKDAHFDGDTFVGGAINLQIRNSNGTFEQCAFLDPDPAPRRACQRSRSAPLPRGRVPAESVGPYRILGRLGAGGMGEVFLAGDPRLGRRVALKTLAPALADRPDARERLRREARAAAAITHPNIAAIFDVFESDAGTHIVMESVEGTSLDALVRGGPLPVRRALQIGLELADALDTAHARGVVHRDLKPGIVRLTPEGHVKVLDFGLARTLVPEAGAAPVGAEPTATLTHL